MKSRLVNKYFYLWARTWRNTFWYRNFYSGICIRLTSLLLNLAVVIAEGTPTRLCFWSNFPLIFDFWKIFEDFLKLPQYCSRWHNERVVRLMGYCGHAPVSKVVTGYTIDWRCKGNLKLSVQIQYSTVKFRVTSDTNQLVLNKPFWALMVQRCAPSGVWVEQVVVQLCNSDGALVIFHESLSVVTCPILP